MCRVRGFTHHETKGAWNHAPYPAAMKEPKSDARIGGMVATVALLLIFVFTILFIWIA